MKALWTRHAARWLLPVVSAIVAALLSVTSLTSCANDGSEMGGLPLKQVFDVPLGGQPTRLDYESFDPERHLLYIAHLGDSEVIVFDTRASRVVGRIPGVASVHGVLAVPELSRVYASATGSNEIVAIDEATLKITARMPGGRYPDGMAYAPDAHKLYVSDETGETETVIDVRSNTRVATIALGGGRQYPVRSSFPTRLRERAIATATARNRPSHGPDHHTDRSAGRAGQSRTADRTAATACFHRL